MSTVSFSEAVETDTTAIIALWRACGLTRPWNDPVADIAFARQHDNAAVLVGRDSANSIIVAVMVGHDGHRGWVYYLAADPGSRRQGLGRQAMAAAETWLRDRGVWKLNILVREGNDEVTGFYRALGFDSDHCMALSKRLDGRAHQQPFPHADDWS
ncbi:MAG: GNAT family acetyltransferase [Alphaproteobacteria bacterium]